SAGSREAPSSYALSGNPAAALARRNEVLHAMLVNKSITSSQYARARGKSDLELKPGKRFERIREPYFFSYVEELLQREYGSNTVREGGLRVYKTINPRLQSAATAGY